MEWQKYKAGFTSDEERASKLRMDFIDEYIVNFDTNLYKSQIEKDWAYICKREYNYDVLLRTAFYSFFAGNLATTAGIFMTKRMVYMPFPVAFGVSWLYWSPKFFKVHNKKFFDMCNVGSQYHLGSARNEVLKECNEILDCEDF